MRFPQSIAEIDSELRCRSAAGRCTEIQDYSFEPLPDEEDCAFVRITVHFANRDRFVFDSHELGSALRIAVEAARTASMQ